MVPPILTLLPLLTYNVSLGAPGQPTGAAEEDNGDAAAKAKTEDPPTPPATAPPASAADIPQVTHEFVSYEGLKEMVNPHVLEAWLYLPPGTKLDADAKKTVLDELGISDPDKLHIVHDQGKERYFVEKKAQRTVTYSQLKTRNNPTVVEAWLYLPPGTELDADTQKAILDELGISDPNKLHIVHDQKQERYIIELEPDVFAVTDLPDEIEELPEHLPGDFLHVQTAAREAFYTWQQGKHPKRSIDTTKENVEKDYKKQIEDPLEFIKWIKKKWKKEGIKDYFRKPLLIARIAVKRAQGMNEASAAEYVLQEVKKENRYYYTADAFALEGKKAAEFSKAAKAEKEQIEKATKDDKDEAVKAAFKKKKSQNKDRWIFIGAVRSTADLSLSAWKADSTLKAKIEKAFKKTDTIKTLETTFGRKLDNWTVEDLIKFYEYIVEAMDHDAPREKTDEEKTNALDWEQADKDRAAYNTYKAKRKITERGSPLLGLLEERFLEELEISCHPPDTIASKAPKERRMLRGFIGFYEQLKQEHFKLIYEKSEGLAGFPEHLPIFDAESIDLILNLWGNLQREQIQENEENKHRLFNVPLLQGTQRDFFHYYQTIIKSLLPDKAQDKEIKKILAELCNPQSKNADAITWFGTMLSSLTSIRTAPRRKVEEIFGKDDAWQEFFVNPDEKDALVFKTNTEELIENSKLDKKKKSRLLTLYRKSLSGIETMEKAGREQAVSYYLTGTPDNKEKRELLELRAQVSTLEDEVRSKRHQIYRAKKKGLGDQVTKAKERLEKLEPKLAEKKKKLEAAEWKFLEGYGAKESPVYRREFVFALWQATQRFASYTHFDHLEANALKPEVYAQERLYKMAEEVSSAPDSGVPQNYLSPLYNTILLFTELPRVYVAAKKDESVDRDEDNYDHQAVAWDSSQGKILYSMLRLSDPEEEPLDPAVAFSRNVQRLDKRGMEMLFPDNHFMQDMQKGLEQTGRGILTFFGLTSEEETTSPTPEPEKPAATPAAATTGRRYELLEQLKEQRHQ